MLQPLVSICVPTYNRPKSLERNLKSLVNQSYQNIEIIISDNCSTDGEVETVINSFISDKRIRYFKQPQNMGAIYNFNFVLDKFSGDYFMRLGDDDWIDSNFIESCLNYLLDNPAYICTCGRTRLFNLDMEFVKYDIDLDLEQDSSSERMFSYFEKVTQNGLYFGLMRKSCKGLIECKNKLADDWLGISRVSFLGKVKIVSETNLNMTQGGTGSSMESIVNALKLSGFKKSFPYFTICVHAFRDIVWESSVYKKVSFAKRIELGWKCGDIIFRRFKVKAELRGSYRSYLKSLILLKR